MNQTNDLTSSPDLVTKLVVILKSKRRVTTYTIVLITIQVDLTTTLAAHQGPNLGKLTSGALLFYLERLMGNLVLEQTGSVVPSAHDKSSIRLLSLHNSLLDIVVNGCLDSTHESGSHIDTLSTKSQSSSQTLAIGEATGGNKWHGQVLARTAQKNEVGDVGLTDVACTFKAVDGQEVHAQLDGGLGVSDRGALVQNDNAGLLQLLDYRTRVVAGGFDDLDTFLDNHLGVCGVVGRVEGGEEGQVDAEGVLGHGAASSDFLAQIFGGGLSEGSQLDSDIRISIQYDHQAFNVAFKPATRRQIHVRFPVHRRY